MIAHENRRPQKKEHARKSIYDPPPAGRRRLSTFGTGFAFQPDDVRGGFERFSAERQPRRKDMFSGGVHVDPVSVNTLFPPVPAGISGRKRGAGLRIVQHQHRIGLVGFAIADQPDDTAAHGRHSRRIRFQPALRLAMRRIGKHRNPFPLKTTFATADDGRRSRHEDLAAHARTDPVAVREEFGVGPDAVHDRQLRAVRLSQFADQRQSTPARRRDRLDLTVRRVCHLELLKYHRTRRRDLDAEPLRPQGDTPRQRRQEHEQKIELPHCGIS